MLISTVVIWAGVFTFIARRSYASSQGLLTWRCLLSVKSANEVVQIRSNNDSLKEEFRSDPE